MVTTEDTRPLIHYFPAFPYLSSCRAASQVEMASMNRIVDVAVLDEVQLLADRSRGWAFTRALLGLPARTLHVCGDPAALPLLERLCAEAGERLVLGGRGVL